MQLHFSFLHILNSNNEICRMPGDLSARMMNAILRGVPIGSAILNSPSGRFDLIRGAY